MDLWIRSQDKRIMLSNPKLAIIPIGDVVNGYNYEIYDTSSYNQNTNLRYGWLGIYKTEERALEVLDEIQKILKPVIFVRQGDEEHTLLGARQSGVTSKLETEFKELSTYVYEMPKE